MWGIENWEPTFVETTESILALCQELSQQVVGHAIERTWIGWGLEDDEWFNDAPIVLRINGVNYEICWQKASDFALTRDSIDLHVPVHWCGSEEATFVWKPDALPILRNAIGHEIQALQLQVWNQCSPTDLNFLFENSLLSIYNDLDANGATDALEENEDIETLNIW